MNLVGQWSEIERGLPDAWSSVQLHLTVADEGRCDRAAALLGPANPGRHGKDVFFATARRGAGIGPDAVRRLLRKLDAEAIDAKLELVASEEAPGEKLSERKTMQAGWQEALHGLPPDWSDVYAEVRLDSTDYLERAALLLAPVNPARYGGATGFRFRSASTFGYGVSPAMAGRCLARCDEEGITGEVEILRSLSDSFPVGTQGPVWLVGGRSV